MMKDRLIRIFVIGLIALAVVGLVKGLADRQNQSKVDGDSVSLPSIPIKEKIEDFGENVLGKAVDVLPGAPDLGVSQDEEGGQVNQEAEPIEEPVKNVQNQTQTLIEMIKKLPEDQVEAIKKQLYQEICEGVLSEE